MTWEPSPTLKTNAIENRHKVYRQVDSGKSPSCVLGRVYYILKSDTNHKSINPMNFDTDSALMNLILSQYITGYFAKDWYEAQSSTITTITLVRRHDASVYRALRHIKKDGVVEFNKNSRSTNSEGFSKASDSFGNSVTIGEQSGTSWP